MWISPHLKHILPFAFSYSSRKVCPRVHYTRVIVHKGRNRIVVIIMITIDADKLSLGVPEEGVRWGYVWYKRHCRAGPSVTPTVHTRRRYLVLTTGGPDGRGRHTAEPSKCADKSSTITAHTVNSCEIVVHRNCPYTSVSMQKAHCGGIYVCKSYRFSTQKNIRTLMWRRRWRKTLRIKKT